MAQAQNDYYNFVSGAVSIVGVTETVGATSRAISTAYAGQVLAIQFFFQFTVGATMTSAVLKIERGTAAGGTAVYTSGALTLTGGSIVMLHASATDQLTGDVAGAQYVLTVTQAGGAGNGSVANAFSAVTVG